MHVPVCVHVHVVLTGWQGSGRAAFLSRVLPGKRRGEVVEDHPPPSSPVLLPYDMPVQKVGGRGGTGGDISEAERDSGQKTA